MSQTNNTEDAIDLKEIFFSLISQWKLIALCIILSLVCALLYLRTTPDTYSVNALVQVEQSKGSSGALLGDLSGIVDHSQPSQAEIELLKSRLVLGEAVKRLNLDVKIFGNKDSFTDRLLDTNHYSIRYERENIVFQDNDKKFTVKQFRVPQQFLNIPLTLSFEGNNIAIQNAQAQTLVTVPRNQANQVFAQSGEWKIEIYSQDTFQDQYKIYQQSLPSAINSLSGGYSVNEKGKGSGMLTLNYTGENKHYITTVLNEILAAYSQQNVERRSAETAQTLSFLDERLPQLEEELDLAEREFNAFREQHNTLNVTAESDLYLNQSINLETRKAELQQRQAELSAKYTAEHPAMQELNAQLSAIDQEMLRLDATLKQLPDLQRQYLQLYRKVEVKQELYTALLNSSQQLNIAKAGEIGNVRIIDQAVEPLAPIGPQRFQILFLSILGGGFIGVILALVRAMLRRGVTDPNQIENEMDLPVYATVPRSQIQQGHFKLLKKKKYIPILAIKNSDDLAIESLRSMRTAIHFTLSQAKNNVIMIAGASPEVGKSFISVNLATILAQSNKRVLLIDGDMRRGYLHKYFRNPNSEGLSEYLSHQRDLTDVIHNTEVDNLFVLPRGKSPVNPAELLSTDKFAEMLKTLSEQYDHVLIDTPPVLAVTDSMIIAQYTSVNLLVARYAKSKIQELELSVNRFDQLGIKVNGFILNDIRHEGGSYGYGYGYGYNYAYGYKSKKK
jgi:tyrosine-protein kinase Etk/Wzc